MATTLTQVRRTMVVGVSAFSLAVVSVLPAAASDDTEAENESKVEQKAEINVDGTATANTGYNVIDRTRQDPYYSKLSVQAVVIKTGDAYATGSISDNYISQRSNVDQRAYAKSYTKKYTPRKYRR